jgi:hypothetical protein
MSISSISPMPNPYQPATGAASVKTTKPPETPATGNSPTAAGPVDSDGDHDGSGLNVLA